MIDYVLKTSLSQGTTITIIYQKGNELTKRHIRVTNIDGEKIKAFCYLRNQLRVFNKENILSASLYRNAAGEEVYAGIKYGS